MVQLKISANYLVTINIDTSDSLTNGATVVLKIFDSSGGKTHTICIHFMKPSVGEKKTRQQYSNPLRETIDKSWTSVFTVDRHF